MAPHSRTLAWKIPWMEEPGRLLSMGLLRVRHDWGTSLSLFTFMHGRRKWQPTPVFLPGESQGWGSLVGFHLWGCTESDISNLAAAAATAAANHETSGLWLRALRHIHCPCETQMASGKLLYNMGSLAQCPVMTQRVGWGVVGGRLKRKGIYAYLWLTHTAVQQKPTQYLKQLSSN